MVGPLDVAFVLGGAVLLFFGAVLSVYGVALLGAVLGGGGGYLVAPTIGSAIGVDGLAMVAVAVLVGAVLGVILTYVLLSFAVAAIAFMVGTYFGLVVVAPAFGDTVSIAGIGIGLGVGILAAAIGSFMTKTMMILLTSAMGAALVSRQLTFDGLETAQSDFTVEPLLFEVTAPIFLGLFVLGILSQFGLFKLGYVTKIVALLPGARQLRDRGEEEA